MSTGKNYNIKIKENALKKTNFPTEMFDYQSEAIDNLTLLDAKYPDYYSTLVVIPTGGGKTRIAVEYLYQNVLNKKGHKVLWIAERLLLLEQAHDTFKKLADRERIKEKKESEIVTRLISSKHKKYADSDFHKDVDLVIITQQTLEKRIDRNSKIIKAMKNWLKEAENLTIVIDEAHHAIAEPYKAILLSLLNLKKEKLFKTCHIIGLTATPKREESDEIEKIFSFGVLCKDNKKEASSETSYAYQISIQDLVSKEVLSIPYMARVEECKNPEEAVFRTYSEGIPKMKFYDGRTGMDKQKELVNSSDAFGQTIVFAESRISALKLEKMFQKSGIECGLAIAVDNEFAENFQKLEEESFEDFVGKSIQEKKSQIREDIKAYKAGNLQLIITVDMLMEGVDIPKTQTIFIAKSEADDVEITQMVGRGLRGKFQGGTPTAFIVSFGEKQLEKILWEIPESYSKNRGEQELNGSIILSKDVELKHIEPALLEETDFVEWKQSETVGNIVSESKMEVAESDAKSSSRENMLIQSTIIAHIGLLPQGYYLLGKTALLIWNGMELWTEEIRKNIASYNVSEELLMTKEAFHLKAREIINGNSLIEKGEERVKEFLPSNTIENYLRHFLLYYMVQCGQSEDTFQKATQLIEFQYLEQYDLSDILIEGIEKKSEEFDEFIEEMWNKADEDRKKAWHDKETFKCFLKPKLQKLNNVKIPLEEEEEERGDYFRVRVYREGRKRAELCEMLKRILLNVPECNRFVDVFGGTGTVTAQMQDMFHERIYNDFDTNLANFIYCISDEILGKDFDKFCYDELRELNDKKADVNEAKDEIETIKQKMGLTDKDIKRIYDLDVIVSGKKTNLEKNASKKKEEDRNAYNNEVESFKSSKNLYIEKKLKQKRNYLLNRYRELTEARAMLEDEHTASNVKRYLAFYYLAGVETEKLSSDDKIRDQINSRNFLQYEEVKQRAFHFLFSRGFQSRSVSGTSVTGIDSKGIQKFNDSLNWKNGTSWLNEFYNRMRGVQVWCKDFKEILKEYENEETIYYLDPPYFLTCQYDAGFPDDYHLEMLEWLRNTKSKWILSCKDSGTNKLEASNWKSRINENKNLIFVENVGNENPKIDEYLKGFLYPMIEVEDAQSYLKEVGCSVEGVKVYKANVQPDMRRKDTLFVYKLVDEKHAEIMISNVGIKEAEKKIFKDRKIEIKEFDKYFGMI